MPSTEETVIDSLYEEQKKLKAVDLSEAVAAFLELGDLRNLLVHENFAAYLLEKTSEEIYKLYRQALRFVGYIEGKLNPTTVGESS